eukprot:TRINITY_DN5932_c0_g1_i2.p1 TRINITY_DN5932_c0_g1~~TRINITY_DN5932_c0_g1_i2.p1  ORF type:complete len:191 (+),score=58.88 TRINITY_DN5932_c0_g1_i2:10-582(+)
MGGIFSNLFNDKQNNNNQNQITEHDRAVLSLKTQRDSLKKFMKKYTELTQKEEQLAKQFLVQGKRDKAKLCLKKKKCQEKLLHDTETNLTNIEEMISQVEFAKFQQQVFESLKRGASSLKDLNDMMKIEDVEDLMDETAEALEHQQEIDRLLSSKLTDEDEEDILKELEELKATDEEVRSRYYILSYCPS